MPRTGLATNPDHGGGGTTFTFHLPSMHSAWVTPQVPQEHLVPLGLQVLSLPGGTLGQSAGGGEVQAHSWVWPGGGRTPLQTTVHAQVSVP
jgi:hypothetical protein